MSVLAPPPRPPRVALEEGDGARRLRTKMAQVMATLATLLATAWLCTLGAVPAIIALMVAKHVLVAIFLMGLGTHDRQLRGEEPKRPPLPPVEEENPAS